MIGWIFIGIGMVLIIIGLIFRIPYNQVRQFASHQVQGKIVDMVWNAAMFNQPREDAANVEHFEIGGVAFQPGTRERPIIGSNIRIRVGSGETDPHKPIIGRGTVNMFHKVYCYVVDGKEYLRADGVRYNKGAVQAWMGKTVPVYYNPKNPQQSTLSNGKGYKITMIILYCVGGLFVLLGIGVFVLENYLSLL